MSVLLETNLPLPLLHRGKVRDNYELGDQLLIVASDRISAFDVVLPCGIPDKGAVLNLISAFWFAKTSHIVPNHLLEVVRDAAQLKAYCSRKTTSIRRGLADRSMIVRKAKRIPIECVVQGIPVGFRVGGVLVARGPSTACRMRPGMRESERVPGGHLHTHHQGRERARPAAVAGQAWQAWWARS